MLLQRSKAIVNPAAGGWSIRWQWSQISRKLRESGIDCDYEFTSRPGDACEIARRATDAGCPQIIAIGGDGTINEVANGILSSKNSSNTTLGIINAGTSCGFARSLGMIQDRASPCSILPGNRRAFIDVGLVECWNNGRQIRRYFVNEASVGFGAAVVEARKKLPNYFGRSLNLGLHAITAYSLFLSHQNKWITVNAGNQVENFRAFYVVAANGKYFADGMQIAPHAAVDDGLLNMVTIGDVSKLDLLRIVPQAYNGNHVFHPKIKEDRISNFAIESYEKFLVEADGDIIGETPASFSIRSSSLAVAFPQ